MLVILLTAVFANQLQTHDPIATDAGQSLARPGPDHWLGDDPDIEVGIERPELVAERLHRGAYPLDLSPVLGLRQSQELRRMRHDRRADDSGAVI